MDQYQTNNSKSTILFLVLLFVSSFDCRFGLLLGLTCRWSVHLLHSFLYFGHLFIEVENALFFLLSTSHWVFSYSTLSDILAHSLQNFPFYKARSEFKVKMDYVSRLKGYLLELYLSLTKFPKVSKSWNLNLPKWKQSFGLCFPYTNTNHVIKLKNYVCQSKVYLLIQRLREYQRIWKLPWFHQVLGS